MTLIDGDEFNLSLTVILTSVYQLIFFLFGGTNFVLLAVVTWAAGPEALSSRKIVLNVLVISWGVRLSGYLFYRILRIGEDNRFDNMRTNPLKFGGFWFFQFLWVWVVSFPIAMINSIRDDEDLNGGDLAGFLIAVIGLVMETLADNSKFNFRMDPLNAGKWCDIGLWNYSRHPNYCGELFFWWGIFISSAQALRTRPQCYYIILSPLFITMIIFGLSGIPILEKNANLKYSQNIQYLEYRRATSMLFPFPKFLYGRMPTFLKVSLFLDFPCYAAGLTIQGDMDNHTKESEQVYKAMTP